MLKYIFELISIVIVALFSSICFGQSVAQIGASKDNTLYENPHGIWSNGAGDHIFAGKTGSDSIRRALLEFDVAGNIPAGAVIDSAELTLHMSRTLLTNNQSLELHRVLTNWGEGNSHAPGMEGGGDSAAVGDATWLHTFFDTQFWTNAGGDFASTVSASQMVGDTTFYTWGSTPQMVADVQGWLDNPANNFGWVILGNETISTTAKRFDSRENPNVNNRPMLTVYYTPSTGISGDDPKLIKEWQLFQNYPNPFNPSTTIGFQIPSAEFVTLKIYDVLGVGAASLIEREMQAGYHEITFDAANLSSGIYFYELRAGDFKEVKRMTLMK